jgi:hypothetical protein
MVVNAHGGLLRSRVAFMPGQSITLVNPKAHIEETCRVVRVENLKDGYFAAAFEFLRASPQFWPIVFPPETVNRCRYDNSSSRFLFLRNYNGLRGKLKLRPIAVVQ